MEEWVVIEKKKVNCVWDENIAEQGQNLCIKIRYHIWIMDFRENC